MDLVILTPIILPKRHAITSNMSNQFRNGYISVPLRFN